MVALGPHVLRRPPRRHGRAESRLRRLAKLGRDATSNRPPGWVAAPAFALEDANIHACESTCQLFLTSALR
jgi:hypothetical protein